MPGSADEILALHEIKALGLVSEEEYTLLRKYMEARPESEAASQIRSLHVSKENQAITQNTFLDTRERVLRRVKTELKTPELKMLEPEEEVVAAAPSRTPALWPQVLLVALVLAGMGWGLRALLWPSSTENPQVTQLVRQLAEHPSGSLDLQRFKNPEGGYLLEYPQTLLGQKSVLHWHSPAFWSLEVQGPSITPADLGRLQNQPAADTGVARYEGSAGVLYTAQDPATHTLSIRSEAYQQAHP